MNKLTGRYFNTAVKMDKALISLLEKKDFEYITVSEICETAQVNRSTFYLHYDNTCDLLSEAVRYMLDDFSSYFNVDAPNVIGSIDGCGPEDAIFITDEYLKPYLSYARDNRKLFCTAMRNSARFEFEQIYSKMSQYIFDPVLRKFNVPESQRRYIMMFYLNGITAIVMEWIKNDCLEPIDDICAVIHRCIRDTILQNKAEYIEYGGAEALPFC